MIFNLRRRRVRHPGEVAPPPCGLEASSSQAAVASDMILRNHLEPTMLLIMEAIRRLERDAVVEIVIKQKWSHRKARKFVEKRRHVTITALNDALKLSLPKIRV